MRVARLINDDWTFGQGKANYARDAEAVRQNVRTRLRSFKNDWFLDVDVEIDWIALLGRKNNKDIIKREVERVTLATEGVTTINRLELIETEGRGLTIMLDFDTVYESAIEESISI